VPKFKPLGELTVTNTAKSAIVPVGAYREIVIYRVADTPLPNNASCSGGWSSSLVEATFRADASAAFGYVGSGDSGRFAVQGSDLQLRFRYAACAGSATYQVAGVE
jgi:hypothetical protein